MEFVQDNIMVYDMVKCLFMLICLWSPHAMPLSVMRFEIVIFQMEIHDHPVYRQCDLHMFSTISYMSLSKDKKSIFMMLRNGFGLSDFEIMVILVTYSFSVIEG